MLIEWLFSKKFKAYTYPFDKSNDRIAAMKDAERTEYYRQAKELMENRVYIQEMQELVRKYYQELALKSTNKMEIQAYRLTLKAIQDLDGRVKALASLYVTPTINKASDTINRL